MFFKRGNLIFFLAQLWHSQALQYWSVGWLARIFFLAAVRKGTVSYRWDKRFPACSVTTCGVLGDFYMYGEVFFQQAFSSVGAACLVQGYSTGENASSSPSLCRAVIEQPSARDRDQRGATRHPGCALGLPYSSAGNNSADSPRKWFIFFSSPVQKPLFHSGGDQSSSRHRCWTSWSLKGQNNWEFAAPSSQSPKVNPPLCLSHSPVSCISILAVRRKTRQIRPVQATGSLKREF